ncbi:hypothetical protein BH10PSE7_BH10PSE7_02420 [soil metagenome]
MRKSVVVAAVLMAAIFAAGAGAMAATAPKANNFAAVPEPVKKKKTVLIDRTPKATKPPVRAARVRICDGFFQCLFGDRQRNVRTSRGVADYATRSTVAWKETKYKPGTIIVRTPERALYYVTGSGKALRYSIGVGREGFQWGGNSRIVMKKEWPDWRPPQVMIEREAAQGHIIPPYMEGGPNNPLGARAMYIGGTMFRIHGTNNAASIGGAVSSGCIRMMNSDVMDLYDRVAVGSPVYVYQ